MKAVVINNGSFGVSGRSRYTNRHTADFLRQLSGEGVRVCCVGMATPFSLESNLMDYDLHGEGIEVLCLSRRSGFKSLFQLMRVLIGCDFVYIFFPGTLGIWTGIFCRLIRKMYGLYIRGEKFADRFMSRLVVQDASFISTVSPGLQARVEVLNPNVTCIRPMIDYDLRHLESEVVLRKDTRPFKILFVGNVIRNKGIFDLIEAFSVVARDDSSLALTIVGGGADIEAARESVCRFGLESQVEFTGLVREKELLASIYRAHDIFVLPTLHEGFPRVLHEAMIFGLPVAVTMVGGIPGYMKPSTNCLEIKPNNPASIVQVINQLLRSPMLRKELSIQGRATVEDALKNNKSHIAIIMEEIHA